MIRNQEKESRGEACLRWVHGVTKDLQLQCGSTVTMQDGLDDGCFTTNPVMHTQLKYEILRGRLILARALAAILAHIPVK